MIFWKQKAMWGKPRKTKPEDKAWKNFSLFIRIRDAIKTMGRPDIGRCVTCKKIVSVKGNDAGHYVGRANKQTKYHEQNVHLQCRHCNSYLSGNMIEYRKAMVTMYGEDFVKELENIKGIHKEFTDWEEESKKWIVKRKELLANYKK